MHIFPTIDKDGTAAVQWSVTHPSAAFQRGILAVLGLVGPPNRSAGQAHPGEVPRHDLAFSIVLIKA
jgi:hypothetical protein